MSPSVGVVVPAYRPDVGRLRRYADALEDVLRPATIRVELDAPEEGVAEAIEAAPVTVHAVPERRGKGAAITCGFEHLDTDVLVFVDADGSTPADSVTDVIEPVLDGRADLGVGSRRHPAAAVLSHQTLARRRLGDGFAWLARRALEVDLYDYQCGAKAVSREAWTAVREHLYEPGFAWDVELIAMVGAFDLRVEEVPVVWEDHAESTVSTVDAVPDLLRALLLARHRSKRVRGSTLHRLLPRPHRPRLVDSLAVESMESDV